MNALLVENGLCAHGDRPLTVKMWHLTITVDDESRSNVATMVHRMAYVSRQLWIDEHDQNEVLVGLLLLFPLLLLGLFVVF